MRILLRKNQEGLKRQLAKFLDFKSDMPNKAVMVNNYDWMKEYSFLGFIREIGKHITVNYMMSKDSVKKRLGSEAKEGMSFTEFSYQLVQGTDFLHLYNKLWLQASDGRFRPMGQYCYRHRTYTTQRREERHLHLPVL